MKKEAVATICHEANRTYCLTIGDFSQAPWGEAPKWQRESAINGVQFHLDNPDATPENSHESWLKEKETDGWKFGEVKDADKKEHPCFKPYAELPADQKIKDSLFKGIIDALRPFIN